MKNKVRQKKDRRLHMSTLKVVSLAFIFGIVALTFSFTVSWGDREKNNESASSTDAFAEFETETIFGEPFTDKDVAKAGVTAFNVWTTTCPACLGEMGTLEELTGKYSHEEFQLVGVCADLYDKDGNLKQSQLEKAQGLMNDSGTTFKHIIPTRDMQNFFDSVIPGFPTTFFVDRDGKILVTTNGSDDLEGWTKKVDEVLEMEK